MLIQVLVLSLKNEIYINNIMRIQRRYNQTLGEYQYYVALTEIRIQYYTLTERSGIFDIFSFKYRISLSKRGCKNKTASKAAKTAESGMKNKSLRKSRRICIRQDFSQNSNGGDNNQECVLLMCC